MLLCGYPLLPVETVLCIAWLHKRCSFVVCGNKSARNPTLFRINRNSRTPHAPLLALFKLNRAKRTGPFSFAVPDSLRSCTVAILDVNHLAHPGRRFAFAIGSLAPSTKPYRASRFKAFQPPFAEVVRAGRSRIVECRPWRQLRASRLPPCDSSL
jgi:hypothetical protein